MMMYSLEEVIEILGLEPLPYEGGLWKKTNFSDITLNGGLLEAYPDDRPLYGSIYYLLTPDTCSCMHRLDTDEIWYHHAGPAVRLLLISPNGSCEIKLLGQDLRRGERPQIMVPRGTWEGAAMDPDSIGKFEWQGEPYTLMSTSMAPEYLADTFEVGTFEQLKRYVPDDDLELLRFLTGE